MCSVQLTRETFPLHGTESMQRHDIQEHMEEGSPCVVSSPSPLDSNPSGYGLRSAKRRHVSSTESPSTSQGSIVTAFLGDTDVFDGHSNTQYKQWF